MSWYRTGTVSVTNGSAVVTGSGTAWIQPVRIGDAFQGPDGRVYEITQVTSNTSLTISPAYLGSTGAGQAYAIQPTRGVTIDFNNNAVALLAQVQSYIDGALAGRFPNGTAALPALSFAAQTNTGLYRITTSVLGLSVNGVERARFTTAGMQLNGLLSGTAVTQSSTDTTAGRIPTTGWLGLGDSLSPAAAPANGIQALPSGSHFGHAQGNRPADTPLTTQGAGLVAGLAENIRFEMWSSPQVGANKDRTFFRTFASGGETNSWRELFHTGNTTVDANGFIKTASPIVRLFADHTEEPVEPVGAEFERMGVGEYRLTGVEPLADSGWRIEVPQDHNGNRLVFVDTDYDAAARTLTITTTAPAWDNHAGVWAAGAPRDIPEGRWVDLRFCRVPGADGEDAA